ncbi:MAG: ArnT family glycosyltransferase [Desulfomonilaceae bacterium]
MQCSPDHLRQMNAGLPFSEVSEIVRGIATRRRELVLALVALGQFCLIVNSSWNATPDSALYLSLGESLARGEGYVFNGEPHTFVPPGFPLILASAARLLGPDFLTYRLLMALTGLLAAGFGYLFITRLCGKDTAMLVGSVFVLNHALLYNSTLVLTDVPYALFTLIALNAALSAAEGPNINLWMIIAGLLMGIPPLIRINGIALPLSTALFFYCSWKGLPRPKLLLRILVFLLLALGPFVLWQYWKAGFPVSESEGTYLSSVVGRTWSYQVSVVIDALIYYFPETSFALSGVSLRTGFLELALPILTIVGMARAFRKGDRLLVPLTVLQFGGLLLTTAGSRYVIFLLPGLDLFLALGVLESATLLGRKFTRFPGRSEVLVVFFLVLAIVNVGSNMNTIWHARNPVESKAAESERSLPFFAAARWLRANAPETNLLTTRPRIMSYLTGRRTVSLVRSGVPYDQIWLDTERLEKLIQDTKPGFLFIDSKDIQYYSLVVKGIESLGYRLKEIPEAVPSTDYHLFRLIPDRESSAS